MKDRTGTRHPAHETLPVGMLLAVVGGFLDAYTYLFRGGVFANAQTGNLVLLGLSAAKGNVGRMLYYLIPILAFFLGVLLTDFIKSRCSDAGFVRWEHIILLLEILLLFLVGFAPKSVPDGVCNVAISFLCSIQVHSFRKVAGMPYASTMCTGNLRSAAESFFVFLHSRDQTALARTGAYLGVILAFCLGAAGGALLTGLLGAKAVWVCCGLLGLLLLRMRFGQPHRGGVPPVKERKANNLWKKQ